METASLDFGSPATSGSAVTVYSDAAVYSAVFGAITLLLLLASATSWWSLRRAGSFGPSWSLSQTSASLRALAALAMISMGLAQLTGGIDAYVQTQIAAEGTHAYFQYISNERLLGMSHAHLFGFFVSFGVQGLLLTGTQLSERTKTVAICFALWAGIADVGSWWGIRNFDPRFEWLSMVCGSTTGVFVLLSTGAVIKAVFGRGAPR